MNKNETEWMIVYLSFVMSIIGTVLGVYIIITKPNTLHDPLSLLLSYILVFLMMLYIAFQVYVRRLNKRERNERR